MSSTFPSSVLPRPSARAGEAASAVRLTTHQTHVRGVVIGVLVPLWAVRAAGHVVRSVRHAVDLVLGVGAVRQVLGAVVSRVAIQVSDLLVGGSVERFGHQSVNQRTSLRIGYPLVPFGVGELFEHPPAHRQNPAVDASGDARHAAHSAFVADLKVRATGHWHPSFCHSEQTNKKAGQDA